MLITITIQKVLILEQLNGDSISTLILNFNLSVTKQLTACFLHVSHYDVAQVS